MNFMYFGKKYKPLPPSFTFAVKNKSSSHRPPTSQPSSPNPRGLHAQAPEGAPKHRRHKRNREAEVHPSTWGPRLSTSTFPYHPRSWIHKIGSPTMQEISARGGREGKRLACIVIFFTQWGDVLPLHAYISMGVIWLFFLGWGFGCCLFQRILDPYKRW